MRKRTFFPHVPTHTYQRARNGNVLFYSNMDRLIYFSIFCTEVRKKGIRVVSMALMFTHIHTICLAKTLEDLVYVLGESARKYAYAFNRAAGLNGDLFQHPAGWSCKTTPKKVRGCLAYVANNPVERKLYKRAEDSRWTFLAFALSDHPFSEKMQMDKASGPMRRAVRRIKYMAKNNLPLDYDVLVNISSQLSKEEKNQLTDIIIIHYSVLDHQFAIQVFGGYNQMCHAYATTTGSDYEIKEAFEPDDDIPYVKMSRLIRKIGYDLKEKTFLKAVGGEGKEILFDFINKCGASPYQIRHFLHYEKISFGSELLTQR